MSSIEGYRELFSFSPFDLHFPTSSLANGVELDTCALRACVDLGVMIRRPYLIRLNISAFPYFTRRGVFCGILFSCEKFLLGVGQDSYPQQCLEAAIGYADFFTFYPDSYDVACLDVLIVFRGVPFGHFPEFGIALRDATP